MDTAEDHKLTKKSDSRLVRLLSYLVRNATSFTVGAMAFVHAGLLLLFVVSDVKPLVVFNFFSVVIYIVCFVLCRLRINLPVYAAIILEVTIYTVVSTYYVGLECGTFFFLFSIIPIVIYFGSLLFKGRQRWGVVLMLVLNFTSFIILYVSFFYTAPVYTVSPLMRLCLFVFSAFAMVFAVMFYNVMFIFSSENTVISLEKRNRQLSADASEDALTNLLNRRGFLPLVSSLMNSGNTEPFCIAFCDLDDFKRINDSYGHDAGDEVLKHTTRIIRRELPGCDICRWGGEEFVILLNDCDLPTAKGRVERLRRTIESNPTVFFNKQIFVTITIGLEQYNDTYKNPEAVIRKSDERMYYGKKHGKNIVIFEDQE